MVGEIHSRSEKSNFPRTNLTELLAVETSAYLAKNEDQQAESAVQRLLDKHPNDEDLLLAATQIFLSYGRYSNALTRIDQQLKMTPDNPYLLVNKGYAHLQLRNYAQALPPLTKALTLETNNHSALLNRAIANLGATNLDEAQHDYESLQKAYPTAFQIYYGLGEIAYLRQDTNAAIRYYQLYLTNSPPGNQEAEFVSDRLKKLAPDRK
jgi:Flp pilus assembly protein TadD